jgi:hypothetical protein
METFWFINSRKKTEIIGIQLILKHRTNFAMTPFLWSNFPIYPFYFFRMHWAACEIIG